MSTDFDFSKLFTRKCGCGSKTFKISLEDIDMIPLSLPADQRVTCTECGCYSIQTVSAEVDPAKTSKKIPKKRRKS